MNRLTALLNPKSVAVIGASSRIERAGHVVMKNLLTAGFNGVIMPVNPRYSSVCGVLAYRDIESLPLVPDVAILCTHASRNVELIQQLADKGVKFTIILSADMYSVTAQGETINAHCQEIAKRTGMRILGPNSLGVILPWVNFNGSFSPTTAKRGNIAFVSQSAAVCTTMLDWANDKGIGFSNFISLGNASDVDFAELLDYLSVERHTTAILLYIDSIRDARRFMSAARAAARNRRILVVKSGRTLTGTRATHQHTGGMESFDIVYDSAIQRSGMLRVYTMHELFAAVETLTHTVPLRGERLAIMTNGGGPAIMALDTLLEKGGKLAQLEPTVIERLNEQLPESWSHSNPVDIVGDADAKRYIVTLDALLDSDNIDAILIMLSPSAIADADETAQGIIEFIQRDGRAKKFNILTNWSGEQSVHSARNRFNQAGIPTYRTPESAVSAFMHLVEYRRNQKQLMETPTNTESLQYGHLDAAHHWIEDKLNNVSKIDLETHQIKPLLHAYEFDLLATYVASDASEAVHLANQIGYPVALKLHSPDIMHKSDVQGVMLNLRNAQEVASAAQAIIDRTELSYPAAHVQGLQVQAMASTTGAEELRVKVIQDAIFGPVILLGQGGSDWREHSDAVASLLPLNTTLARYMIIRALKQGKVRLQKGHAQFDKIKLAELLVRLSQMIIECPQIETLDIHPLLATKERFTLVDVDLTLCQFSGDGQSRLAIRPYPTELISHWIDKQGDPVTFRPILPEDEPRHADFIRQVSKDDLYKRFFNEVGEFNHEALANMTQIDYDREMAFVAVQDNCIIGVSRALINPDNTNAEFAILVRSDLKSRGLGKQLLNRAIQYCRDKGTATISGMTMPSNQGMITLAKHYGFTVEIYLEDGVAELSLPLHE